MPKGQRPKGKRPCQHVVVMDEGRNRVYSTCHLCGAELPFAIRATDDAAALAAKARDAGVQLRMVIVDLPGPCPRCSGQGVIKVRGGGYRICPACRNTGLATRLRDHEPRRSK